MLFRSRIWAKSKVVETKTLLRRLGVLEKLMNVLDINSKKEITHI